jgi:hypothetical protein
VDKKLLLKEREFKKIESDFKQIQADLDISNNNFDQLSESNQKISELNNGQVESLAELQQNCDSLEKFNQELLKAQNALQSDITDFEKLNDSQEAEYVRLKENYDREKLETKIELKNAQEAISYANELEEIQQNNLRYIEGLELKIEASSREYQKVKKYNEICDQKIRDYELKLSHTTNDLKTIKQKHSSIEQKYKISVNRIREFEETTIRMKDDFYSVSQAGKQKQVNLHQLQSTLELKTKTLDDRDSEVQKLSNQLNGHRQLMSDLKEEISLMEKVLNESELNQKSLEEYAEKLKVTTEREIIKRKEADVKYEVIRGNMAKLLTEKENLEAKFKAVEKTLSGIQRQLAPGMSLRKPSKHHLQLDN